MRFIVLVMDSGDVKRTFLAGRFAVVGRRILMRGIFCQKEGSHYGGEIRRISKNKLAGVI